MSQEAGVHRDLGQQDDLGKVCVGSFPLGGQPVPAPSFFRKPGSTAYALSSPWRGLFKPGDCDMFPSYPPGTLR